jgi:hypothetical protein
MEPTNASNSAQELAERDGPDLVLLVGSGKDEEGCAEKKHLEQL